MEELKFEEALKKLEQTVNQLENGDIELEKAFQYFEEGLKLIKLCEAKLKNIENKVAKVMTENNILEDFKENE